MSTVDTAMNNNEDNVETTTTSTKPGGIRDFVAHTSAIGHVIMGTAHKESYEPLPFTDYSLFNEEINPNQLRINVNLHSMNKIIFIPKTPILVKVTAERKHAHYFHPYSYTIELKHGDYEWKVIRSYKEIKDAHRVLAKEVKKDIGQSCSDISKTNIRSDWPIFPTEHDHLIPDNEKDGRCQMLAEYLKRILTYPPFRDNTAITNLIGVSPLSFTTDLGASYIEGILAKRSGDNIYYGNCSKLRICCDQLKIIHLKRWFCIKETYITYLNPSKGNELGFPMLVDRDFTYKKGIRAGALYSISIKNSQRSLVIKCKNESQQTEWFESIDKMVQNDAKDFSVPQRFNSFAPLRENQKCKWYVNADEYMQAVLNALNVAKEEIFITDWWLCPEIFLKRPSEDLQYRLDKVLLKKAKDGVKIYVLLFKEVELAIGLKSLRAKRILTEAGNNQNIKVLRHPEHTPAGVFLWSHHEKCVIIDQSVCFIGGIDLCFGRWDDDLHRLIDLGRTENQTELPNEPILNPSSEVPNLIRQVEKLKLQTKSDSKDNISLEIMNSNNEDTSNNQQPPSSDAMLVAALMGKFVAKAKAKHELNKKENNELDTAYAITNTNTASAASQEEFPAKSNGESKKLKRNINSKTNYVWAILHKKKKYNINNNNNNNNNNYYKQAIFTNSKNDNILPAEDQNDGHGTLDRTKKQKVKHKWDRIKHTVKRRNEKLKRQIHIHSGSEDSSEDTMDEEDYRNDIASMPLISYEGYYWIGKDYANTYKQDFKNVEEFGKDQFNREVTPRMPWRDQALVMFGEAARDVARHFIQRWNQCKREKVNKNTIYPFLLPKSYINGMNYDFSWFKDQTYDCRIQITRSLDTWSGGLCRNEFSILNAYEHYIESAEHFIYIENQFFVTTTDPVNDPDVKNVVGKALVTRIKRAHANGEKFRVYVVLPLLPGFDSQNAIQAVQYYNLRSINIGKYSIYDDLKRAGIEDPSQYITFHGMRNYSVLMKKLVHEIIYVHSKLMIVDDKHVICGSANINDRSLLGSRDSELAAIISDNEFISGTLNDKKVQVGKYAQSLRLKIFKLHLGVYFENTNRIDVIDCVSDAFYNRFRNQSKINTDTYDEVFKCIPSDNILTFNDLITYPTLSCLNTKNPSEAKNKLDERVRGFIVDFPLKFLSQEKNFFPNMKTAEGLVPTQMWT